MYKTKKFRNTEHLDTWLNSLPNFEIIGYQAHWLGTALGTEIVVTVRING